MTTFVFFLLLRTLHGHGVSGDEMKSVFATEGDSVTLHTLSPVQSDEMILWSFGPDNTVIVRNIVTKFTDRIRVDKSTGSLTINNITANFSGIYKSHDVRKSSYKSLFNVTIYAVLPVPVIIRDSSQCSSSCSVVCSVVNVSHVTLSWLKGNSLLSSVSVSDLSISLSLPLEVEDQEKNTYRCEINNPVSNQSTHLEISALCQLCEGWLTYHTILVCSVLAVFLALVLCGIYCFYKWKRYKQANRDKPGQEEINLPTDRPDGVEMSRLRCSQNKPDEEDLYNSGRPQSLQNSVLDRAENYSIGGYSRSMYSSIPDGVETYSFGGYSRSIYSDIPDGVDSYNGYSQNNIEWIDGVENYFIGDYSRSMYSSIPDGVETYSFGGYSRRSKPVETYSLGACSSQKSVTVNRDEIRTVSVNAGESMTLETDTSDIQEDEIIEWKFASSNENRQRFSPIASWNKRTCWEYQHDEGIFKDRLLLDQNTGSLIITNVTLEHSGQYKLHITDERQNISMILFNVAVHQQ